MTLPWASLLTLFKFFFFLHLQSPTHEFSNIATATSEFSLNKKDHNIKRAPALYPTVALSMQDKIAFA